ncbi:MAG: hypothetical protein V3T72_20775 [Thermoanaerobaculia bacterium]
MPTLGRSVPRPHSNHTARSATAAVAHGRKRHCRALDSHNVETPIATATAA